jgi:hypothetical protein
VGFQLVGRPWQEASLLAAARCAAQRHVSVLTVTAHVDSTPPDGVLARYSVIEARVQERLRLPAVRYDVLFGKQS